MLANKFVKDPHEVVKAGEVVKVKVLEVDEKRKRIALTMRLEDQVGRPAESAGAARGPIPARRDSRAPASQTRERTQQQPQGNGAMAEALANAFKRK
jgi:uncharacterized protein